MALAMLALVMVVTQVEAGYGRGDVEFASGLGQDVDSVQGLYDSDAGGEVLDADELTRRRLTATTSITYGALQADKSPCPAGSTGSSYYGCASTGTVSPYTRSCTAITKCARG